MVDITTTCRTCMKNNESLLDLFGPLKIENNSTLKLADVLTSTTSLEISQDDGLPQNVCNDCVKTLEIVYNFYCQAINSQAELQRLIQISKSVKDEEFETLDNSDGLDYFSLCNLYDDVTPKKEDESENKIYKCEVCSVEHTHHHKFQKHLLTHETPKYTCPQCSKGFHEKKTLDKHVNKHCKVERKKKKLPEEIKVKIEDESNLFRCMECPLAFNKQRSLISHQKKHKRNVFETDKLFKCDHCGKVFTIKTLLKRHLRIHLDKQEYKCNVCPKSYSRQDQLSTHMFKHNGGKPYKCPHCSKDFSQVCSLKDHVRIHTGETPFLCSECGKGFKNSSNLRQHLKRHTGVKPFACKLCPKTFCTKGQVKSHMDTHTGAHPFKCIECDATFTKAHSLKKHKLIHLGIRSFKCDTCNMSFTCKDHLKRHQRIHTGEKPYRCTYCERSFTQSNDLVKHMRSHIGQNLYNCKFCDMKFRLLRELKSHYPVHYINKERPKEEMLILKDCETINNQDIKPDTQITITFNNNSQSENGIDDITISLTQDKICN